MFRTRLVQLREADVAPVLADLLDRSHDRAQPRARDVGEAGAVDHELEALPGDGALDLGLEEAHGVSVDEALGGR